MKKTGYAFTLVALLLLFSFIPLSPSIVGNWTIHTNDGSVVTITFHTDGSYTAVTPEVDHSIAGKYIVATDTLALNDENCGVNMWGKYKITFYGEDSLNLKVIADSCDGRKEAVDGVTAKRVAGK